MEVELECVLFASAVREPPIDCGNGSGFTIMTEEFGEATDVEAEDGPTTSWGLMIDWAAISCWKFRSGVIA